MWCECLAVMWCLQVPLAIGYGSSTPKRLAAVCHALVKSLTKVTPFECDKLWEGGISSDRTDSPPQIVIDVVLPTVNFGGAVSSVRAPGRHGALYPHARRYWGYGGRTSARQS
jgi:hypothetical protein